MNQTYLNSPKVTPAIPSARPIHWTVIGVAAIAAGTIISITDIIRQPLSRPTPVQPIQTLHSVPAPTPTPLAMPTPEPLVLRAQPIEPVEPVVRRALPVEGSQYRILMPGGEIIDITYRGEVQSFDGLPRHPNVNDCYLVRASKHSWVFMQPAGFSAPAWVDP